MIDVTLRKNTKIKSYWLKSEKSLEYVELHSLPLAKLSNCTKKLGRFSPQRKDRCGGKCLINARDDRFLMQQSLRDPKKQVCS